MGSSFARQGLHAPLPTASPASAKQPAHKWYFERSARLVSVHVRKCLLYVSGVVYPTCTSTYSPEAGRGSSWCRPPILFQFPEMGMFEVGGKCAVGVPQEHTSRFWNTFHDHHHPLLSKHSTSQSSTCKSWHQRHGFSPGKGDCIAQIVALTC